MVTMFENASQTTCNLIAPSLPTIIYDDNYACINQLKNGHIKEDRIKQIAPTFFFICELNNKYIDIQSISLNKN